MPKLCYKPLRESYKISVKLVMKNIFPTVIKVP